MTTTLQDLRYAARMLMKAPAFAAVAILTLALGIAINTAIFSVVNALLLRPLPYPASDRLVMIWQDMRARGGPADEWATPGNYVDWRARTDIFSAVTVVRGWSASLVGMGEPEPLVGEQVTHEYLDVLATPPALGRAFRQEDDVPNAPRVVIIGHSLWERRFGGDPRVIGRVVSMSGEPHEVIGVMPQGFRPAILPQAEVWRPNRLNTASPSRGAIVFRAVARLKDGVTVSAAAASLDALARRLEQVHPEFNARVGFTPVPMHEQVVGPVRPALLALWGAVAFVLLIACVNIANLLLARGTNRGREMAVRMALGAARARLVRQLLTESVLLAAAGGAVGILLGTWGVSALVSMMPAAVPHVGPIEVDARVLAFAVAVTCLTGILFGLVPAWQASREDFTPALKEGGRGTTAAAGQRARRALIVSEIALALMLLVGSGLLLRTFATLQRADLGFSPSHVLSGFVNPPPTTYESRAQLIALYDRLLEGAASLPGVTTAALSSIVPLGGDSDTTIEIEGQPAPSEPGQTPVAWYRLVSAEYFTAMGIQVRSGRVFRPREAEPVIVVNETMARRYWAGENPIGRRVRASPDLPWFRVVGVVNDVKIRGARGESRVELYAPYWQMAERGMNIVVKTASDPALVTAPLRRMVASIDPELPVSQLEPMETTVADSLEQPRFFALLAALFAAVALALAAVGIYGVMSYAVAQRTSEIGVRLALGAAERQILGLVLGDGLRLAAAGLAVGIAGALAVGRLLKTLLFGVAGTDPLTYAVTGAILLGAALLASYVPARRAMRTDPMTALRTE